MAEYVTVATVDEVPPGRGKQVQLGGTTIGLYRLGDRFYAIEDLCTHEMAFLSQGTVLGEMVVCPKHGSRFHIATGRVMSLPAVRSVATFPVRVVGNEVQVSLEATRTAAMPHKA